MIALKCNLAASGGIPHVGYIPNIIEVMSPNKEYANIMGYVPNLYTYELFVPYYISDYFRRRQYREYLWEMISYLKYNECTRAFGPPLMKVGNNTLCVWYHYIDGIEFMITCADPKFWASTYSEVTILFDQNRRHPYQYNIKELRKMIQYIEKYVGKRRLRDIRAHYKISRRNQI